MNLEDFWWKKEFLDSEYGESNRVEYAGCTLPFKVSQDKLEIGFIGPYSLAYMDNLCVNKTSIFKAWEILIEKYPNKDFYIRLPPKHYYSNLYEINIDAIQRFNSKIIYVDVNQHLELLGNFESRLRRDRLRDLKKADTLKLNFRQIELSKAYKIIEKNRLNKQIKLSISIDRMIRLSDLIPNSLNSFGIFENQRLIASSIVYTINSTIAYVFMWGHDPEASNGGVGMTVLCKGLFDSYKNHSFKTLCLGTSSLQGIIDIGLMSFKKGLGAVESSREVVFIPKMNRA
jgi:hypothetical protein